MRRKHYITINRKIKLITPQKLEEIGGISAFYKAKSKLQAKGNMHENLSGNIHKN